MHIYVCTCADDIIIKKYTLRERDEREKENYKRNTVKYTYSMLIMLLIKFFYEISNKLEKFIIKNPKLILYHILYSYSHMHTYTRILIFVGFKPKIAISSFFLNI